MESPADKDEPKPCNRNVLEVGRLAASSADQSMDEDANNSIEYESADSYVASENCSDDGDDEDNYEDNDGLEDDEEDRELMIECGRRQGRWERWEERCHEAMLSNQATPLGLSHEEASAKRQQIFKPKEAFMMLSKELLDLFKRQSLDMYVDSVGDDVYTWNVELASFNPESKLQQDMQEMQRKYAVSFVKLIISFKRGLHPFYPPSIEVVRPHFKGSVATAVASHPLLKLGNWDPLRPVSELINHIKVFLERAARVDLDHPMNEVKNYPASSYRPVEVLLARLNALSGLDMHFEDNPEMRELCTSIVQDQTRFDAVTSEDSRKRQCSTSKRPVTVWAQGTGYGSGSNQTSGGSVWDSAASEVAQHARDEELRLLLEALEAEIRADLQLGEEESPHGELEQEAEISFPLPAADGVGASTSADPSTPTSPFPFTAADGVGASASAGPSTPTSSTLLPYCHTTFTTISVGGATPLPVIMDMPKAPRETQTITPDSQACVSILSTSCVIDFLIKELKVASFTDMCSRTSYYLAVIELARVMSMRQDSCSLLWQLRQGVSVASLLQGMLQPAQQYAKVTQPVLDKELNDMKKAASLVAEAIAKGAPPPAPLPPKVAALQQESLMELQRCLQLAAKLKQVLGLLPLGETPRDSTMEEARASGAAAALQSYCQVLQSMQVEYVQDLKQQNHAYAIEASAEGVQPKARMSKLARELAGLQQLLPLNEHSSIFVRVDENNVTLWRALITGPEDTPYSSGCFIFDFYFPPNYPAVPPKVQLKTTGGGRVRFNPNLYNNGKVCLSLLGTWDGAKGEGWDPTVSTALQVLLSIQSLILVPDPYFNEPGYEQRHNSEEGKRASRDYNKEITEGTLRYAMIDLLQHPPVEFEAVLKAHFRLRKDAICDATQSWIDAAQQWNPIHARSLGSLKDQLSGLLKNLSRDEGSP
ncbi:hypothetical protein CEUSTIGMA_g3198.t1 [Chlamydomonas eustigma]|uniref:UBC core domain-containing protein n=1 Tax=Chlamydomonas eustigma TaxID=1157962 RepID=A0A250WY94_9CHLO|nr:hypothetical protein CEUSTIGMA_g3198.t1 [Chlamydomonas eustigma]|eukprot:GAX75755.1 hypothetical protein CEUSTIGMA_g3198.t1 [Chlamydomonas eustigma]